MRVLVIEDDMPNQIYINEILSKEGHDVRTADCFESAKPFFENTDYEIIISDYKLPDGTALEIIDFVKSKNPFAIIIIITGYGDSELLIEFINKGAYGYIQKPFDKNGFMIVLNKAIEYKKLLDENIKLSAEVLKKTEMEKELKLAKEVQLKILLKNIPQRANMEIYAKAVPAGFVGGDFYDIINISDSEIVVVIGDVAGKGLKSSIVMVMILSIIRTLIQKDCLSSEVMDELNRIILKYTNISMYSTCFIAKINTKTLTMEFINAGHEYPAIINGNDLTFIKEGGIFLGAVEEQEFKTHKVQLRDGDLLLLYTDGFSDSFYNTNISGEKFVVEQNMKLENGSITIKEFVESLISFRENLRIDIPRDDNTIIALKINDKVLANGIIRFSISSNDYEIENVKIILKEIWNNLRIDDKDKFSLNYAVLEVIYNSFQHAYLDNDGIIEISIEKKNLVHENEHNIELEINIRDYGSGMEPETIQIFMAKNSVDLYSHRGRGLFLTKNLVDTLEINSERGKGTNIKITKKLKIEN